MVTFLLLRRLRVRAGRDGQADQGERQCPE
jgi:hypothetical protein